MIALFLISLHWCWFAGADSTAAVPFGDDSIGADPTDDDDSTGADPACEDSTSIDSTSAHSNVANGTGAEPTGA